MEEGPAQQILPLATQAEVADDVERRNIDGSMGTQRQKGQLVL